MNAMRQFRVLAVGFLAVIFGLVACDSINPFDPKNENNRYTASESFSYIVNTEDQSRLVLKAINGPVEIIGSAEIDRRVEVWGERIVVARSRDDAQRGLARLQVSLRSSRNEVNVETLQPNDNNEYRIVYHIRLPQTWNTSVVNSNGEVAVDSIRGRVEITQSNGNVRVRETGGDVVITLSNGQVEGKSTLPPNGTCKVIVSNGQLNYAFPVSTDASFVASVTNGAVSVVNLPLQNSSISRTRVSGTLGDGSGSIDLRVSNGNIAVRGE